MTCNQTLFFSFLSVTSQRPHKHQPELSLEDDGWRVQATAVPRRHPVFSLSLIGLSRHELTKVFWLCVHIDLIERVFVVIAPLRTYLVIALFSYQTNDIKKEARQMLMGTAKSASHTKSRARKARPKGNKMTAHPDLRAIFSRITKLSATTM